MTPILSFLFILSTLLISHHAIEVSLTGDSAPLSYPPTNISRITSSFISYCKIPTQADPFSSTLPSSKKQLILAEKLYDELVQLLGKENVKMEDSGFVYGFMKGNAPGRDTEELPTIALLAHMDTTYQYTDVNCQPQVHENYEYPNAIKSSNGKVIVKSLDERYNGHTIISSNGDTILGADDKAGVAVVMEVARLLAASEQNLTFPNLVFTFTVDEEIGKGAHHFDVNVADFAYTVDGGERGEYSFETFSADSMEIRILGQGIHPAIAKGKLVNALRIASSFVAKIEDKFTPEHTEDREGFVHLIHMQGNGEEAKLHFLIRSFDDGELVIFENYLQDLLDETLEANPIPGGTYEIQINQSYRNMKPIVEKYPDLQGFLLQAMSEMTLTPKTRAMRGGTDGSILSFRGLPTLNVFSGMQNIHSESEFASVNDMDASVQTLLRMLRLWGERGTKRQDTTETTEGEKL